MNHDTRQSKHSRNPQRAKLRPALVVARWALVAAWVGVVAWMWPSIPHLVASLLFCFLLVNALWQHVPLKRACLMAFALTGLSALTVEFAVAPGEYLTVIVRWTIDAVAAAVGALAAYLAMPVVDRVLNPLD